MRSHTPAPTGQLERTPAFAPDRATPADPRSETPERGCTCLSLATWTAMDGDQRVYVCDTCRIEWDRAQLAVGEGTIPWERIYQEPPWRERVAIAGAWTALVLGIVFLVAVAVAGC